MTKLNGHQSYALGLINEAFLDSFLGYENTLQDAPKDSEDYKRACEVLNAPREVKIERLYRMVAYYTNKSEHDRHIRFAGADWIKERISKKLEKYGY